MKTLTKISAFLLAATPVIASAQTVERILDRVNGIINFLIPMLIALALVYFFWGLINYVIKSEPGDKKDAKAKMFWGIIAFFVMVGVWGLVALVANFAGVNTGGNAPVPGVSGGGRNTPGSNVERSDPSDPFLNFLDNPV